MSNDPGLESFDGRLVVALEEIDFREASETPFRVALLGDWSVGPIALFLPRVRS